MLFNSFEFLVFVPIVFGLYWLAPKRAGWQNATLLLASFFFYGWWDWRVLGLFVISIGVTVVIGRIVRSRLDVGCRKSAKAVTTVGVVSLLAVLGFFKYYNFFADSLASILSTSTCRLTIILPLGISFYTFMCISYLVDIYTGKLTTNHEPLISTLTYLAFFPQIAAGPIGRGPDLLPQYGKTRYFNYALAVEGCRQMLWGFVKKLIVADTCASVANTCLDVTIPSSLGTWIGVVCFTFQIYADFSGYSDMAIGCAKLFGIRLMRNFSYPYFASNIADFWRGWHISLTSWFRDYLYIPLGGSRHGVSRKILNTFAVFLTSGLWHGANWTFVVWGAFHALCFMPGIILRKIKGKSEKGTAEASCFIHFLSVLITFIAVTVGWSIFRAPDVRTSGIWLQKMFVFDSSFALPARALDLGWAAFVIVFLVVVDWVNRNREVPALPRYRPLRIVVYYALLFWLMLWRANPQAFIYFKF